MLNDDEPARFEMKTDLAAIERIISHLSPCTLRIDRDRLMFEAGRAAGMTIQRTGGDGHSSNGLPMDRQSHWAWPAVTAAITTAAVLLACLVVPQRVVPPVVMQQQSPPDPTRASRVLPVDSPVRMVQEARSPIGLAERDVWMPWQPTAGYLYLRHVALTHGVEELNHREPTANATEKTSIDRKATQRDLLLELLPEADLRTMRRS